MQAVALPRRRGERRSPRMRSGTEAAEDTSGSRSGAGRSVRAAHPLAGSRVFAEMGDRTPACSELRGPRWRTLDSRLLETPDPLTFSKERGRPQITGVVGVPRGCIKGNRRMIVCWGSPRTSRLGRYPEAPAARSWPLGIRSSHAGQRWSGGPVSPRTPPGATLCPGQRRPVCLKAGNREDASAAVTLRGTRSTWNTRWSRLARDVP
jgi:hypothetical protein